jgi:hypothetical protein
VNKLFFYKFKKKLYMGANNTTEHINDILNKDVAESVAVTPADDIYKRVNIDDQTAYIISDSFTGNPFLLLGQVIEIRKSGGVCPTNFNDVSASFNFSPFPVTGIKIDEETRLKKPELRSSIIVNKDTSGKVGFLSYLNGQLDAKSSFSLMVFDQAKGLVNFQDETWTAGVRKWIQENRDIYNDPEICYLYVISGFVQKNIVRKKYVKFEAGVKGGAYGININGELATSTEDYSLDIVFGLTPAIIKRPSSQPYLVADAGPAKSANVLNKNTFNFNAPGVDFKLEDPILTDDEKKQFSSATGKTLSI